MPSDTIVSPSAQNTLRARERDTFEDHVQKHMHLRPRRMADKEGRHLAEMQTNLPKRAVRAARQDRARRDDRATRTARDASVFLCTESLGSTEAGAHLCTWTASSLRSEVGRSWMMR